MPDMYSTYQLNKQEQADHTRQAAIAKPVRKIPEKPELVVSSSCRGTKAAFGVMRHSDEIVAKSDNALCQLNQALRVCDCCVAVAHQTERSLRSSAAATETASSLFSGFFVQACQLLRDGCGPLDRVCLTDTLSTYPAFVSN